jgi:aldose 1-epimerase
VTAPRDALTLRAGDLEAELWPSLGGRIAALRTRGGPDWLQPIPVDASPGRPSDEALRSGGVYPMAPYCGRIEHGRFNFEGREIVLPPHPLSAPHSLHGIAWESVFVGERLSDSSGRMTLRHPGGGGWPWAFTLVQTVSLTNDALRLDMTLENIDHTDQPAGLGFHPFFPRRDGVTLTFEAARWWRMGPTLVPLSAEPIPERMNFAAARPMVEGFDDVFAGFGGKATLAWPHGAVAMTSSPNLTDATLFSPKGQPFFCFEPISHAPNAHNREGKPGLAILKPGERLDVAMTLTLERP